MKKLFNLVALLISAVMLCGCTISEETVNSAFDFLSTVVEDIQNEQTSTPSGKLNVFYLDVGQGDSELIELPDGKTMLIDAGTLESGEYIIDFIRDRGISTLDYVIATHPHADHIGIMSKVLDTFDIGEIYMPNATANTLTFEKMLDVIEKKNIRTSEAKAGVSVLKGDGISAELLAPCGTDYKDLNNYSAVLKLNYGSTSFLFMGDAEEQSENEIRGNVQCDVIKVGHHGSNTSSSPDFVNRTKAKYAVISAGKGNSYGLPTEKILQRWKNAGAEILRTDEVGTIAFTSDGSTVQRID